MNRILKVLASCVVLLYVVSFGSIWIVQYSMADSKVETIPEIKTLPIEESYSDTDAFYEERNFRERVDRGNVNRDINPITSEVLKTVIARETLTTDIRGKIEKEFEITDEDLKKMDVYHMKATAYTLSVESCGKSRSHPEYGITRSGRRVEVGRTIAVDPRIIPLGSIVYIEFPDRENYNGLYVAEDTGRLVKGHKLDVFLGEDEVGSTKIEKQAMDWGVRKAKLYIIQEGNWKLG